MNVHSNRPIPAHPPTQPASHHLPTTTRPHPARHPTPNLPATRPTTRPTIQPATPSPAGPTRPAVPLPAPPGPPPLGAGSSPASAPGCPEDAVPSLLAPAHVWVRVCGFPFFSTHVLLYQQPPFLNRFKLYEKNFGYNAFDSLRQHALTSVRPGQEHDFSMASPLSLKTKVCTQPYQLNRYIFLARRHKTHDLVMAGANLRACGPRGPICQPTGF